MAVDAFVALVPLFQDNLNDWLGDRWWLLVLLALLLIGTGVLIRRTSR